MTLLKSEEPPAIQRQSSPYPGQFIVTYDDGVARLTGAKTLSWMIDLQDCDGLDHVVAIYAVGLDNKLHEVVLTDYQKVNQGEEHSLIFAQSKLVTDDGLHVGTVHFTDH